MPNTTQDYITLVVHTPERAGHLSGILTFHGVDNRLEPVNVDTDMPKAPVKVMVKPSQLALALKILESGEDYSNTQIMIKMAGMSGSLLIPVDFSDSSMSAVAMGFDISRRLGLKPVILHAWLAPMSADSQKDSPFSLNDIIPVDEAKENEEFENIARESLSEFKKKVDAARKSDIIPDLKYTTSLIEGVAEEVIGEYCRINSPSMVVMSTRDRKHKESELIGSVSAEVVDSCRIPVLTIPANYACNSLEDIKKLIMFCSLSNRDIFTLRWIMKSFNYPACSVYLVPMQEKLNSSQEARLQDMKNFFMTNYPTARFHTHIAQKDFSADVDALVSDRNIDLMIVPNKKSSPFRRIFSPTLAHRMLFRHDVPMLFVPV